MSATRHGATLCLPCIIYTTIRHVAVLILFIDAVYDIDAIVAAITFFDFTPLRAAIIFISRYLFSLCLILMLVYALLTLFILRHVGNSERAALFLLP